ncbi:MAG: hypothetical protein LBQ24_03490 [Candidatus Peribacteria bacterium]|nr:hypothetical protein [Candidatus Peribacteria bacterium]
MKIYFQSSVKASLHPATGHSKGVQAISKVILAPTIPQAPKFFCPFEDKTVAMI